MRNVSEKSIIEEFLKSPLFKGCDSSLIYDVLEDKALIKTYPSSTLIMEKGRIVGESSPSIAYVASGRCLILSCSKSNSVIKISNEKDLLGLAGVFAKEDIETKIVACGGKKVVVLSIDLPTLETLMSKDVTNSIRNNLFTMLADKISFLNKKISTLTGGKAEKKVAMYLLSYEKDQFELGISMSALSSMLDIGRSSLYRSIDSFVSKGVIKREDDSITILDKEYLRNI